MRFNPKIIPENVNVSRRSPLKELFVLLAGIGGALIALYIILGFVFEIIIRHIPAKTEASLGKLFSQRSCQGGGCAYAADALQKILDDLTASLEQKPYDFTVTVHYRPGMNAVALPGGTIVVFNDLLENIESENELTFILAHELGHFIHRDHLRGFGRGLVFLIMSNALFGTDSSATGVLMNFVNIAERRFSRTQEESADLFALDLLIKKYGHCGGALDFFNRLEAQEHLPRFLTFFSTHPVHRDRLDYLIKEIAERNCQSNEKIPLPSILQSSPDSTK